jgi:hypothetical protein
VQPLADLSSPAAPGKLFKRWCVGNHAIELFRDSPTDSGQSSLIALMSECEL